MTGADIIAYRYQIKGTAAEGQTWATAGEVSVIGAGSFMEAFDKAMQDSFSNLTHGKATFGSPGVGCCGPYRVKELLLCEVAP